MLPPVENFPLQGYVDRHNCRYFAENFTGDGETLRFALRSQYIKLFSLDRNAVRVTKAQTLFQDNQRVQVFTWTHDYSWIELVRLVPTLFPATFWLHREENVTRGLVQVARLRPERLDVLIIEAGSQRGIVSNLEASFGRTHVLEMLQPDLVVATPRKHRRQ